MNGFNAILTRITDTALAPFASAPATALVVWSMILGVGMAIVFRFTTHQAALRRAADASRAAAMGLRLFRDDLRVALSYQVELVRSILWRFALATPPLLVLALPFIVILAQLSARYETRPLAPGESATIDVAVAPEAWPTWQHAELTAPDGATITSPSVRDVTTHTISWRVRADATVSAPLVITAGADRVEMPLAAAERDAPLQRATTRRPGASAFERTLHPTAPGFADDAAVRAVDVTYPARRTPVFGLDLPWWLTFLIASMLGALLCKPIIKVQF